MKQLTKQQADDILHEAIWLVRDRPNDNRTIEVFAREIVNAKTYLDGLVVEEEPKPKSTVKPPASRRWNQNLEGWQ